MALAMFQTAWLVCPCWDINEWRIVGNNTRYQLERHWPVPKLRNVYTECHSNTPTFYTARIRTIILSAALSLTSYPLADLSPTHWRLTLPLPLQTAGRPGWTRSVRTSDSHSVQPGNANTPSPSALTITEYRHSLLHHVWLAVPYPLPPSQHLSPLSLSASLRKACSRFCSCFLPKALFQSILANPVCSRKGTSVVLLSSGSAHLRHFLK